MEKPEATPRGALETQVRDLERLHEMTMKIARSSDRSTVLHELIEAVLSAIGAAKGILWLWSEDNARMRVAASVGLSKGFLKLCENLATDRGPCGRAGTQQCRVIVEDVKAEPLLDGLEAIVRAGGFAACHSVPLLTHDGEMVGVLTAHFAQRHVPDERETRLMDLYARMAADLIARDRVVAKLRDSEARFRTLANHAPVGIFLSSAAGETIFVNQRWCEMAGLNERDRWVAGGCGRCIRMIGNMSRQIGSRR